MTKNKTGHNYTEFYQYEENSNFIYLKRIDNSGKTLFTHNIKFNTSEEALDFFENKCG